MTLPAPGRQLRSILLSVLLLGASGAHAGPAEDYIAARTKAFATVAAAVAAGRSETQLEKIEKGARKDLEKRMIALVGPLKFKGLEPKPLFSPETLVADELGADSPDGLVFIDRDGSTYVLVSPEPVFADWLKARAAEEHAPAVFKDGIKAAARGDFFYTLTVSRDAAFSTYATLPLPAAAGEEAYAALGLFAQDLTGDAPPDSVVVTRIADGRVIVGSAEVKLKVPDMPACAKLWKDGSAKADALMDAAHKSGESDDPRMEQAFKLQEESAAAFRACFARDAAAAPVLADAAKRAEALLALMRGK